MAFDSHSLLALKKELTGSRWRSLLKTQVFYDTKQAVASVYVYDTGTSKEFSIFPRNRGHARARSNRIECRPQAADIPPCHNRHLYP